MKAPVNKIIPLSLVDGPGSRTAVFLQGCGFNCRYCHNPETIAMCSACGACAAVCPAGALELSEGAVKWTPERCCGCDACIRACPRNSSPKIRFLSADDVMREIAPALPFAQGITVSGGECTLHDIFLAELFQKVHEKGKTAFVDTNGQRDFRTMPALAEAMDMAMLDVKSTDAQEHLMLTGQPVSAVLSNLEYLLDIGKLFEIRTVVVPGLLDSERTVRTAGRLISRSPGVRYKLIKFRAWGVREEMRQTPSPADAEMERLASIARENGVQDIVII